MFNRVYKLPKTPVNISYGYMDCNHRIWLCSRYSIALYDTQTGEVHQMSNELKSSITSIEQVDNNHFFMGTDKGLRYVKLENETLQIVPLEPLDKSRPKSVHSISTKNHKDFSSVLLKRSLCLRHTATTDYTLQYGFERCKHCPNQTSEPDRAIDSDRRYGYTQNQHELVYLGTVHRLQLQKPQ